MIELKTELYSHQRQGVEKLLPVKVGALYMEMGTGKTRTALELIKRRADKSKINHILWLCPCSVKTDLKHNIKKHADISDDMLTICGIETLSSSIRTFRSLLNLVMTKECYLIVDESNLVKNPFVIRSRNILKLSNYCKYKLILNGTPITRTIADMFSQWQILDWRILGYRSYYSFSANHLEFDDKFENRVRKTLNIEYLIDKISPYSYQVKKNECLNLPSKNYDTYYFSLTNEQEVHYRDVLDDFLSNEILCNEQNFGFESAIYRTFTALQQVTSGEMILTSASKPIEHKSFFSDISDNPRIQALLDVIKKIGSEKIIIWCKFQKEIYDIYNILSKKEYRCCCYQGTMSQKKREESINSFQKSSQILIANKSCASYGLNLQFCHNAIYYNNDWNWATRVQSEDRMHRIGQNFPITIIDICAEAKIDERILDCLSNKESLVTEFKQQLQDRKTDELTKWLNKER